MMIVQGLYEEELEENRGILVPSSQPTLSS